MLAAERQEVLQVMCLDSSRSVAIEWCARMSRYSMDVLAELVLEGLQVKLRLAGSCVGIVGVYSLELALQRQVQERHPIFNLRRTEFALPFPHHVPDGIPLLHVGARQSLANVHPHHTK